MNEEIKEDSVVVVPSTTPETTQDPVVETEDPLKTALEKVQSKGRTKAEKLLYTKKRVDEQLKELGIEDEPESTDEDDQPLTVGQFKKMQAQTTTQTAVQLAEDITNPTEKELVIHHLENTIRSTGDAKEDLELARGLANAVKNKQIIEEANRKVGAPNHSSGGGAPAKMEKPVEFTADELAFMKPPFSLTKEQIIAARPK